MKLRFSVMSIAAATATTTAAIVTMAMASAHAANVAPLASVFLDANACHYMQTAFQQLTNEDVTVDAECYFGKFTGRDGQNYNAELNATLTIHGFHRHVDLSTVLVDPDKCSLVEAAFRDASTDTISVDPLCVYGSFLGRNGADYGAEIESSLTLQE